MSLTYKIEFSKDAKKYLNRLDKPNLSRIFKAIETISESPRNHPSIKKMNGYDGEIYRFRVGDSRILYEIIDDRLLIFVFKIGPRGDIYKKK